MGNMPFVFTQLKDFDKFFVGFDDQYDRMVKMHDDLTKNIPNYPPYNIRKTGENTYVIEIALAGFAKQDIEIELVDGKMVIRGKTTEDADEANYLFKGIANRGFTRTFALEDQIEVQNAEMLNGMLKVFLEKIIPEHKKPKKIDIGSANMGPKTKPTVETKSTATLLNEDREDRDL